MSGLSGSSRRPGRVARPGVEELEERAVPTLLGQQLFPSDYPWNQNIANAPVAANSAAVITRIGAAVHVHPDWGADSASNGSAPLYGIPVNVVHGNTTPRVNVVIDNYPGSSVAGGSVASDRLPYGARLRLRATAAVNAAIGGMGPQAQVVARAMQQYGLVLADNGGAMYVTGAPAAVGAGNQVTLVWDMADVAGLSSLNAGMFDVVDL